MVACPMLYMNVADALVEEVCADLATLRLIWQQLTSGVPRIVLNGTYPSLEDSSKLEGDITRVWFAGVPLEELLVRAVRITVSNTIYGGGKGISPFIDDMRHLEIYGLDEKLICNFQYGGGKLFTSTATCKFDLDDFTVTMTRGELLTIAQALRKVCASTRYNSQSILKMPHMVTHKKLVALEYPIVFEDGKLCARLLDAINTLYGLSKHKAYSMQANQAGVYYSSISCEGVLVGAVYIWAQEYNAGKDKCHQLLSGMLSHPTCGSLTLCVRDQESLDTVVGWLDNCKFSCTNGKFRFDSQELSVEDFLMRLRGWMKLFPTLHNQIVKENAVLRDRGRQSLIDRGHSPGSLDQLFANLDAITRGDSNSDN